MQAQPFQSPKAAESAVNTQNNISYEPLEAVVTTEGPSAYESDTFDSLSLLSFTNPSITITDMYYSTNQNLSTLHLALQLEITPLIDYPLLTYIYFTHSIIYKLSHLLAFDSLDFSFCLFY